MLTGEKERMVNGELYDASDPQLTQERLRARRLFKAYNDCDVDDTDTRQRLLRELIPNAGAGLNIEPPFYCDYGWNIYIGENVFFNFNCVVLDVARVLIGDRVLFGPGVHLYTATHPLDAATRRTGLELGKPVTIGDDVWIGGGAIICPGVTIGSRTVIGAGSVVTRDIPADVVATGNPCRIVRKLVE